MRRLALFPALTALLLLAACNAGPPGAQSENTTAIVEEGVTVVENGATGNDAGDAANAGDAYCAAVDFVTSAAQCRRFTQEKSTIETGLGVLSPPRPMKVGESQDLVFGIGRAADAAEVHESVGGNAAAHVEVRAPIGHNMTATLTGGGFDITPAGPQAKTLSADRRETWEWRITAKEAGMQQLLLVVSVDASAAAGQGVRYELARKTIAIRVDVTDADKREARTKRIEEGMGHAQRVMGASEKLLIALAALIAAAGGVWLAVRHFGKEKGAAAKGEDGKEGGG